MTRNYTTRNNTSRNYTTYTTHNYTTRNYTTRNYTTLHYTTRNYTTRNCTTRNYTTRNYTTRNYTTRDYATPATVIYIYSVFSQQPPKPPLVVLHFFCVFRVCLLYTFTSLLVEFDMFVLSGVNSQSDSYHSSAKPKCSNSILAFVDG